MYCITFVQISIAGFVTEEKAQDVEQFFKDNPTPRAERVINQKLEGIRLNIRWLERDAQAIKEWLKNPQ